MTVPQGSSFDPRRELLPHIIDHYAKVKPDALYAEYPKSPLTYEHGYRQITFRGLANAVNGLAAWLIEKLGPGNGEILSYVGANDVRYPALVLGAVKAGYVMFYTSPRNSTAAHESLFKQLNCTKFLAPTPRPPPVAAILDAFKMDVLDVPSVDELLDTPYPHFAFPKTYPEAARERLVVVHTSGSTGIPKPIFWTHDVANKNMEMSVLDAPDGFEVQDNWMMKNKRVFSALPPFHAAGLAMLLFLVLPVGGTVICPTSGGLPSAAGLVEIMKQTPVDVALVAPFMVLELAQNPQLLEYCSKNLGLLAYAGGDLPQAIGDAVASRVRLINRYGASEMGLLSTVHSDTYRDRFKDWRYIHFHPALGAEFRHVTGDEYELVFVRSPDREPHLMMFALFPELQEYHTRDLFIRHPDEKKADLWRYSARADDVVVFLNGEKTNPVSMEQHITASNPDVTGVLVAGARRFQASLIVEFDGKTSTPSERAAAIEKIWPSVEEANAVCPAHARIAKTHILFTTAEKPMLRAGKGTIQRAGTLNLYTQELDSLYADADRLMSHTDGELTGPGRVNDAQVVSDFIRQTLTSVTGWSKDILSDTDNFFHLGLDSLQAITAARLLKRGLEIPSFTLNLIYLHSSISELTQAVLQLQQHQETSEESRKEAQLQERDGLLREFQDMLETPEPQTVILTGSTGTLGTYLLDALLKDPRVAHVHCLNRKADSLAIQRQKSAFYGLNPPLDSPRVSFWTADLSRQDLGLHSDVFKTLHMTTSLVVHNAWAVNFNLSLPSFKPHLAGVVNLAHFSSSGFRSPRLFFISSISSVMSHRSVSAVTPEEVVQTQEPGPNSYADSKYLAEQLLDNAAREHGLRVSIARVGQVAGAVRSPGLWNRSEWFPSLVLSSLHVGAIPDTLGPALDRIDWVPIDLLAEVLVDLALQGPSFSSSCSGPVNVAHPLNLSPTTWEAIRPVVSDTLSAYAGKKLEVIPLSAWISRVRQDIETAGGSQKSLGEGELQTLLEKNPAAKLLDFFETAASTSEPGNALDTQKTAKRSEKLQAVETIKPEWIHKWVREWIQPLPN